MDPNQNNCDVFNLGTDVWTAEKGLTFTEKVIVEEFFPKPKAKILDIGCGAGRTTYGLSEMNYDVIGIDYAEKLIDAASKEMPEIEFLHMDATDLKFDNESFDSALFSFNGMDYIHPRENIVKMFHEVERVLKPGGVFFYSSHNVLGQVLRKNTRSIKKQIKSFLKFIKYQIGNVSRKEGYYYFDSAKGKLLTFAEKPSEHVKLIKNTNFELIKCRGLEKYKNELFEDSDPARCSLKFILSKHHIFYILRKKAA